MGKTKLTISILVSNNKENVARCLESIKPLLDAVDSELILTDTGVDAELRAIMETYTNHIIDYTWNQNFSEARNLGLRAASGEWFLYVDDDEWFEDVTAISNFLNSEEEKKYNVACYVQRNYYDFSGTEYMDHIVDRILRINPKLHFEHRVHEAYTDIEIKSKKMLDAYVHHYGYVYASEEQRASKSRRNQTLLELECQENPTDMRMRYQLVMNQYELEDWDEAIRYAKEVLDVQSDSEYWDLLHTAVLYCYEKNQDWDNVIEEGRLFLEKKIFPYEKFAIRQFLISAYFEKAQDICDFSKKENCYQQICEYAQVNLEEYNVYQKDISYFNKNQLMHTYFIENEQILPMVLYAMVAGIALKNDTFLENLSSSGFKTFVDYILENEELSNWMEEQIGAFEGATNIIEKIPTDIDRLTFDESFFKEEVVSEFKIERMVKHAWAANLEVLHIIDQICRENNISYFADWGTLLGAVRHKGYIPWDDDIDICMLRSEIQKFYEAIKKYEGVSILNNYNCDDWGRSADKVVCNVTYTLERRELKRHYGFPFTAGVDIFIVDYVNRDKDLENEQIDVLKIISEILRIREERKEGLYKGKELKERNQRELYLEKMLYQYTKISFKNGKPTDKQLNLLWEDISGLYQEEDADYVSELACLGGDWDYYIPKEYYLESKRVPFENTTIPIPLEYDFILKKKYGEDYMTPRNVAAGHGYPFYKAAAETVSLMRDCEKEEVFAEATDIALAFYDDFMRKADAPKITIEQAFFEEEAIDGVVVSQEQKRIWAALLETYAEVKRICEEEKIPLFAIGDTLIGADYLGGFLPETTDLHLAVRRCDQVRFINALSRKLSSWFDFSCLYTQDEHEDLRLYVMSDSYLCGIEQFKKRFHGCDLEVGIDIAFIDGISDDAAKEEKRLELVKNLLTTAKAMPSQKPYSDEVVEVLKQWKDQAGIVVDVKGNFRNEFAKQADQIAGAYRGEAKICRITAELQEGIDILYKTEWFEDMRTIPFGPVEMNVPVGYQEMLG